MKRIVQKPRQGWQDRLTSQGFHFHSIDPEGNDCAGKSDKFYYWREDVAYEFTETAVERLYEVIRELHAMGMALVGDLVQAGNLSRLGLPVYAQELIEKSWSRRDPHMYGRFDLSWDGVGQPKMLEYNADTPTSIIETAVAQWNWLQDVHPQFDQFNSLHEALVERMALVSKQRGFSTLHLLGMLDGQEDCGNLEYLLDVAVQAGLQAKLTDIRDVGRDAQGRFVDEEDYLIQAAFKLYPWEWMVKDDYASKILDVGTTWLEPAWKMVLSNKALLPLLWEKYTGHPNLLPAYFSQAPFGNKPFVKKPLFSREGANIEFIGPDGKTLLKTEGEYGEEGYVYQGFAPVASFPAPETTSWHGPLYKIHTAIGAWVVGDEAVGMAVREDVTPVTSNTAYFVPHYFKPGT